MGKIEHCMNGHFCRVIRDALWHIILLIELYITSQLQNI